MVDNFEMVNMSETRVVSLPVAGYSLVYVSTSPGAKGNEQPRLPAGRTPLNDSK